ncbi:uncharacterized protein N7498_002042 [Penicillium cinerascens]|uniref:Protein kinase domain-containing protein n=1 Tax=Penicillium cinerascens TaxID=70096 RepID=A0A9W9N985_9EURO|nr:uncharacterized protein N7498_002042 [Penicillium cinerascens]KAJ5215635.1 hypothetical protein N7498_002042 [Penicillium cinerascens]
MPPNMIVLAPHPLDLRASYSYLQFLFAAAPQRPAMAQQPPIYDIGPFKSSTKNTDTQLNVYVSNKRFRIDLFTSNFESSPALLAEYLRHVQHQEPEWIPDESEVDADGEYEDPLDEMHDWILQPFLPIFHEINPLNPSQKYTLEDFYGGDTGITTREILTYSKIHMAKFDSAILTSQLEGLVQDDDGDVMGLVLSYIDYDGATLNCLDGRDPRFSELRQKWVDQISHKLKHLHAHNIIWGDAKAAIVLIDVNEDAYLIDFGGGCTEGWVDKEKSNSIEGDLQGLQNIKRYLFE